MVGSRRRIPLYYGGSFAYLAAVVGVVGAEYGSHELAQVGIVATGVLNILVGWTIQRVGKENLDKVLPASVTGPIAIVIGIALAKEALDMATINWGIALCTMVATILFSVYLRGHGLIGMLPILLGLIFGYVIAAIAGDVDFTTVGEAAWLSVPNFQLPAFTDPDAWRAIVAIAPIAVATIPESNIAMTPAAISTGTEKLRVIAMRVVEDEKRLAAALKRGLEAEGFAVDTAHLYQVSLYVDEVADEMHRPRLGIKKLVGLNLVLDGLSDITNGMLGVGNQLRRGAGCRSRRLPD